MKSFICFPFFFICIAFSQELQFNFKFISRQEGLSNPEVFSLLQDRTGFLWIGTIDGLNRYDGYSFRQFKNIPFNENTLSESFVYALAEDSAGNIWAGTGDGGINKIESKTLHISRFKHDASDSSSLPDDHIRFLFVDSKNNLWIGSIINGIARCDLKTMKFEYLSSVATEKGNKSLSEIRSIAEDAKGNLWFGSSNNELIRYDSGEKKGKIFKLSNNPDEKNMSLTALRIDSKGKIWIGSNIGTIVCFDPSTALFSFQDLPVTLPQKMQRINIASIYQDKFDDLWISSSYGLFRYSILLNKFFLVIDTIAKKYQFNRFSRTLLIDRSNVFWIGTYIDGLIKMNSLPKEIENLNRSAGLANDYVRGIYEDGNGILWIGTTDGLTIYNTKTKQSSILYTLSYMFNGERKKIITSVCGDTKQNIWIGTLNGVFKYFPSTKKIIHILGSQSIHDQAIDNYIYEVQSDKNGFLWVSTDGGGLILLDESGNILRRYSTVDKSLPIDFVRNVIADSNDILWVGTFGAGLCKVNKRTGICITYGFRENDPLSLSNNFVISIFKDSKNQLWIGTRTGLNKFNESNATFEHFLSSNGPPNDLIVGIQEDNSKNLWLSTYYGISKYNGENFQNYFAADGFQDDFNSGSTFKNKNGKLFFGGSRGLCMFTPESLNVPHFIPPIIITATKHSEHPVSIEATPGDTLEIILEPAERSITFEFATLDFKNPEGNTYGYMLEGFDKQWIYSGTRRNVSYTNLDGGNYTFRVKAQGRTGVWYDATTRISLSVIPPLVERWWFYPVLVFLVTFIAAAFYRTWLLRKLEVEEIRSRIASDLHDEIGSGLARIAVLSDIEDEKQKLIKKIKSKTKSEHEIETSSRIGIISRELMESIADVVWSIDPRNDRSEQLLDRIHLYATQICEEGNLTLEFSTEGVENISIEPFMKRALLLVVKESMNNIMKHAKASLVLIVLKKIDKQLLLIIRDNGLGFDESALGRINGLNNMRARAEESGGTVQIKSEPKNGTIIEATFPV